jgi:hypothetical protein
VTLVEELREHAAATAYDDVRELMVRAAAELDHLAEAARVLRLLGRVKDEDDLVDVSRLIEAGTAHLAWLEVDKKLRGEGG